MRYLSLALALATAAGASAADLTLVAKSGTSATAGTAQTPYRVPRNYTLQSRLPRVNDAGQVAFAGYDNSNPDGNAPAAFFLGNAAGVVSFGAASDSGTIPDPSLSNNGNVYFTNLGFPGNTKVMRYSGGTATDFATVAGGSSYTGLNQSTSGNYVGFSASVSNSASIYRVSEAGGTPTRVTGPGAATIGGTSYTISSVGTSSYGLNDAGTVATRVSYTGGSAIALYNLDGAVSFAAQTATGSYTSFANYANLNDAGQVAFGANLTGGESAIWRYDSASGTTVRIASSTVAVGGLTFNNVTNFGAPIDGSGNVYFTAQNKANSAFGIFKSDGASITSVVSSGDTVTVDGTTYTIGTGSATTNPFSSFSVSENGTLGFSAALRLGTLSAGNGILVATSAPVPEPASMAALAFGALGVIARRRRRQA